MTQKETCLSENDHNAQDFPLPEAFTKRMRGMLGADFGAFRDSYECQSAYGLRYNPLKADREHFENAAADLLDGRVLWAAEGYHCLREAYPGRQILHEAGAYYIQEPSAMSAAEALFVHSGQSGEAETFDVQGGQTDESGAFDVYSGQPDEAGAGERILDLCAAPGGKTTQIAGKLAGNGLLAANEVVPSRARILSQNVERFGIRNCVVLNEEPERLAERFPLFFHKILVDAPCSGEGMFRKDEKTRGEWNEERVRQCAERQSSILENADRMLMPGGRLVYSTCTFAPDEDEGVIACFLRRHPDYELIRLQELADASGMDHGHPEWTAEYEGMHLERCLRLWPHRVKGEGHFIAALQKQDTGREYTAYRPVQPTKEKAVTASWMRFAREHLNVQLTGIPVTFGNNLYLVPEQMRDLEGLKIERAGLHVGEYKKDRFEPSHALALALRPQDAQRSYALSRDEAERFLRGEALIRDEARTQDEAHTQGEACTQGKVLQGWTLLSYAGYTLGWGKASGNQIKNHYPKGLRIMGWKDVK